MPGFTNIIKGYGMGLSSIRQIFRIRAGFHKMVALMVLLFFGIISLNGEEILVGGTLTEDQVFTNGNVYIVYKDLRIPEGITLMIEAGVIVKIDQGRGILVLGGNLTVEGQQNDVIDSVHFVPNYLDRFDGWKWKGISYTGVSGENNRIAYANIVDAEIAVDIYNSTGVLVENSCILDNQNIGVRLYNSKNCQIIDCLLQDNYDGVEMVATNAEEASGNKVQGCVLKNFNHNIYMLKAFGGMFMNNTIEQNLIEKGNNGIWMDNGGGEAFGRNLISKNIFVDNGTDAGYALLLSQDSIDVYNNIFWQNRIAINYDQNTSHSDVRNNSFYQNEKCILLASGAIENRIVNNTFSSNTESTVLLYETQGIQLGNSNIFPGEGQEFVIVNKTPDDITFDLNYWNAPEEEIPDYIYDQFDDSDLGEVIFRPLLPDADTSDPISPPMQVIKQLVHDQVLISWKANLETDQRTYRVYSGLFENYSFPGFLDTDNDTSLLITGVNFNDSLAVTALDNSQNTIDAQVNGHESPFAFAVAWPYAGDDDIICKNVSMVQVKGGSIPFAYESLSWATGGDGSFSDPNILSPVYFPGLEDKESGEVILTMGVLTEQGIMYDSLTVYMYDEPIVSAGNDTIIFEDAQLDITTAYADYYESVYWITTGDGSFSNDTLINPSYIPGVNDIALGEVKLVLMAISECGMASDTMFLFFEPFYSLEGRLWFDDELLSEAAVLAVKDGPAGARAVEMEQVATEGTFRFERLSEGNYYVYAVPDTLLTSGAVPGYYANDLRWQQAHYFMVDADVFDVDISLPSVDFQLPKGEASISGFFESPQDQMFNESIYCGSWFDPGSQRGYCNGGLSNITVLLYNSNGSKLLDFTLTDEFGNFYFNRLPYGSYIIDAEKAGYQTSVSSLISLSPEHKNETGVTIVLNAEKIAVNRAVVETKNDVVEIYPNPARDHINIFIPVENMHAGHVELYNTYGQLVIKTDNTYLKAQNMLELNIRDLPAGMYMGRWMGENGNHQFTFIKY